MYFRASSSHMHFGLSLAAVQRNSHIIALRTGTRHLDLLFHKPARLPTEGCITEECSTENYINQSPSGHIPLGPLSTQIS
jgi:hypothetical protein